MRRQGQSCARATGLRHSAGFRVTAALGTWLGACQLATATDHPVEASTLSLKGVGRRQSFHLRTTAPIELPSLPPEVTGASVTVLNPVTGETATIIAPSGGAWTSSRTAARYVG